MRPRRIALTSHYLQETIVENDLGGQTNSENATEQAQLPIVFLVGTGSD